jgi:hypothetical protein
MCHREPSQVQIWNFGFKYTAHILETIFRYAIRALIILKTQTHVNKKKSTWSPSVLTYYFTFQTNKISYLVYSFSKRRKKMFILLGNTIRGRGQWSRWVLAQSFYRAGWSWINNATLFPMPKRCDADRVRSELRTTNATLQVHALHTREMAPPPFIQVQSARAERWMGSAPRSSTSLRCPLGPGTFGQGGPDPVGTL